MPYTFLIVYPLPLHQSEVRIFVIKFDDMTIGGDLENILHNLSVMKKTKVLGLTLNNEKSEIICEDATVSAILCSLL